MTGFDYQHWLSVARRLSRKRDESADLLHDAIVDAVRADRVDFTEESTRRWFAGVLRNRAAMAARSAVRRIKRNAVASQSRRHQPELIAPPPAFIASLPRSARAVAALVVAGMRRDEICSALRLPDTAFRQRLTTIRQAWERVPAEQRELSNEPPPLHPRPDPGFQLGLIRRALLSCVRRNPAALGTHDPDGHLIVIESSEFSSQDPAARQRHG